MNKEKLQNHQHRILVFNLNNNLYTDKNTVNYS